MLELPFEVKSPIAWLPAGLISWYAPDGLPVALVTSWISLVGLDRPRIRTAWHGRHDSLSRFWPGGDFVLNVPHEDALDKIRAAMATGKRCLKVGTDLGYACTAGTVAAAPRLLDCAVQIECVSGTLADDGFEAELCGEVVLLHREKVVIDPLQILDLCAIQPLKPL